MGFLRGKGEPGSCAAFGLAALIALTVVPGAPSSAQRAQRRARETGIESVFAERRTPVELRRRLMTLDASAIPFLFRSAAEGRPCAEGLEDPAPFTEEERQVVRGVLAARPRRELIPFLEELTTQALPVSLRLEAQRLLGSTGSGEHLRLLARLTVPLRDLNTLAPVLRAGFRGALASILNRDTAALAQVPALFVESPPALCGSVVEGLASVEGREATQCLAALLGRSPGLDPLLLARLSQRGRGMGAADEAVLESIRRYLGRREPELVISAANACGELGDDLAVVQLVALVDHDDARVRQSVFSALERISGLSFGPDPERWTRWYQAELRWWDEESEALLVLVERGHGVEFARAARIVLEHNLFRDRIAESFAQVLRRRNAQEVFLSCRALEQLRSPVAVRALVECLEREEPLVREAAWKALRAITGAELPPEADSWSATG